MMLGITLTILVAILICVIGRAVYDECFETWSEHLTIAVTLVLVIVVTVVGLIISATSANTSIEKDCYEFIAVRETYEALIVDDNLSGMERIEIAKTALEHNKAIASRKVDLNKWYTFYMTRDNKELIRQLQPISIDENKCE